MNKIEFIRELRLIQVLILIQRTIRLLVRAAWTFGAGYLLGWGTNALFGWLSNSRDWVLLGLILASMIFIGIFIHWPKLDKLAWSLDRNLELQEQVSAAYQSIQRRAKGVIFELLVTDAVFHLKRARSRIIRHGWFLARDVLSGLIVLTLFGLVFWNDLRATTITLPKSIPERLPPLGREPSAGEIFPSGIPGLDEELQESYELPSKSGNEPGNVNLQDDQSEIQSELNVINSTLQQLGAALGQQAASFEVGQALERGDILSAASLLEDLADQIGHLSPSTKERLAMAIKEAIQSLAQAGGQTGEPLKENLENAVVALEGGLDLPAKEALSDVSDDLRDLAKQMAGLEEDHTRGLTSSASTSLDSNIGGAEGSSAVSGREIGQPETDRHYSSNEGETLELVTENNQSGLLQPGVNLRERGVSSVGGSVISRILLDQNPVSTILTPYYYSWRWRDVVSSYFSPD